VCWTEVLSKKVWEAFWANPFLPRWFLACVILECFVNFLDDPYYEPLLWFMILLSYFKFILCIKCNIWHLHCTKNIPKHAHYYVLKITALLECFDLFVLDVVNIFEHEYCTSNRDLQNIGTRSPPSQSYHCSYIMIWSQFLMINNLC